MEHSSKKQTSSNPRHHNFPESEFACKCGTNCGTGFNQMQRSLLEKAYAIRDMTGLPMVITSAYRCSSHIESKRRPNSAHTRGFAIDFRVTTSNAAYLFMEACFKVGIKRMGWNQDLKFFHIDTDPSLPQQVLFPY